MQGVVMLRFIKRKNVSRTLVSVLFVFLILGFFSCNSSPTAGPSKEKPGSVEPAVQQNISTLGTFQINFVDAVTNSLNPSEVRAFQDPGKNSYILELVLGTNVRYRQIWNAEALEFLSHAVSLFMVDIKGTKFTAGDTRAFTAYGSFVGLTEWSDASAGNSLSAEPGIDLGYFVTDGKGYFLVTQRDSPVVGDTTGQLRSSRITFCITEDQVRVMMGIFNCTFIEKPLLVFLGENITSGYNVTVSDSEDPSKAYPAVLEERLSIHVLNSSDSWAPTAQTLERVSEDVAVYDPDIVVIELGYSDFLSRVDPAETSKNLQDIITILKRGERKIYLVRFYDERTLRSTMEYWEMTPREQTNLLATYDTMFRNLSRNNNIELITGIWDGLEYDDTIGDDSLHPTAEGQRIMAGNLYRSLRPYLEANKFLK